MTSKLVERYCFTPAGINLGPQSFLNWNSEAHTAVLEKIVRGLYFHHFKELLNPMAKVKIQWHAKPIELSVEDKSQLSFSSVGGETFEYGFGRDPNDKSLSVWLFSFYRRHWAGGHSSI